MRWLATVVSSAALCSALNILWPGPTEMPSTQPLMFGCESDPAERIEQRVVDLPEDGNSWHTILLLRSDWRTIPYERRAESMFHSEPLLVSLKHQTHWHLITTDDPQFEKFRPLVATTPCLLLERANGEVVYRESGPDLGRHPHALTRSLRREIERHCPDGRCLPLHPVPDRDAPLDPPAEIPSVLREVPPAEERRSSLPGILLLAAGALTGAALHLKKTG